MIILMIVLSVMISYSLFLLVTFGNWKFSGGCPLFDLYFSTAGTHAHQKKKKKRESEKKDADVTHDYSHHLMHCDECSY